MLGLFRDWVGGCNSGTPGFRRLIERVAEECEQHLVKIRHGPWLASGQAAELIDSGDNQAG